MRLYDGWGAADFNTKSVVDDEINKRKSARGAFGLAGVNNVSQQMSAYSVVGMNANKIPQMIAAIESWTKGMEKLISEINEKANQNTAFQGEAVQTAVKVYIENVKSYCINLISDLNAFSDKLVQVRMKYEENLAKMGQTVQSVGGKATTGEYYTRQF